MNNSCHIATPAHTRGDTRMRTTLWWHAGAQPPYSVRRPDLAPSGCKGDLRAHDFRHGTSALNREACASARPRPVLTPERLRIWLEGRHWYSGPHAGRCLRARAGARGALRRRCSSPQNDVGQTARNIAESVEIRSDKKCLRGPDLTACAPQRSMRLRPWTARDQWGTAGRPDRGES